MEHSATAVPKGLTVEEVLQLAQQRWLRTPELCEILANPEIIKLLFASQRKDKPTNGAIFAIYKHRLPVFKDDGHVWAKKESHENLKDKGVVVLICKYVYGKIETNFKRRIYQMKEHGDIVLFHYRKDQNQENRKIWRRGTEVFIVTPQSIQKSGQVIPTWAATGVSSGIVDHSSNQVSVPPQTASISNLNFQENVESTGCSSGIVDHNSNQLSLPLQTANTSNLNIQENVESADCSSGVVDHNSNQLPLSLQTANTSNLNIRENVESAGCSSRIVVHNSNQLPLPLQTTNTSNQNIQENVEYSGCSSSIVGHSSNQLSLPPQTANTSNLNIQENVEFAGCSSGTVNHENYQFPLAPKTVDTGNQNSIQANAQSSGSSFGIVNHENDQLPLPPKTTDSSNQSNIQANVESADFWQHLIQITEKAEFSTSYIFKSFTVSGDGMLHYDYEFENQTFPQGTTNDFFTNPATPNFLPSPTPGSPSELPDFMEPSLEGNKKNLKRGKESPGELPANSLGVGYQDHMSFQQNPELQEDWNNCKRSKKLHILAMPCPLPDSVHHNIQGSAASGVRVPFEKEIENDFLPRAGIPAIPCEWPELIKNVEQFPEFIFPAVNPVDYFGDITNESLLIRFENMLSLSFVHPSGLGSNMSKISLEEKFHFWLQEKASEGENGVTVLDEGGAGVIHLAAGLGYDWAIETLIVDAKIDINFNDKNGCTALHWAAYCGRKNTVEFLISKDAAHALPSFPPGSGENTPANLAFAAGHQEIGHYLEEKVELSLITLTFHLDEYPI